MIRIIFILLISFSGYAQVPGEDPYEKVKKNLFLKVMVDKRTCFVGQPVLATFKLYSRLESRSDIIKNPGFYGFTVYDMVNLSDKQSSREKVNGRMFDVHTIRKVQLYPLQAGDFTIDAMEVKNRVEFSRSAVRRKTEQQIVEGVLGFDEEPEPEEGTEVVETEMHTERLVVHVKPVPENSKPAEFMGAVGEFSIKSTMLKDKLDRNEQGIFEISVTGKGNFIQISAPKVEWPDGIEGFEPLVQDVLDKNESPLSGRRVYRYPFVAARSGEYSVAPIRFSFFKPDSGVYKTIRTNEAKIHVSNKVKQPVANPVNTESSQKLPVAKYWIWISGLLLLVLAGLALIVRRRSQKKIQPAAIKNNPVAPTPVKEMLAPAAAQVEGPDKIFFGALHRSIWEFMAVELSLGGSEMNKSMLQRRLKQLGVPQKTIDELLSMITLVESGMFTNADLTPNKTELLKQTATILQNVRNSIALL